VTIAQRRYATPIDSENAQVDKCSPVPVVYRRPTKAGPQGHYLSRMLQAAFPDELPTARLRNPQGWPS